MFSKNLEFAIQQLQNQTNNGTAGPLVNNGTAGPLSNNGTAGPLFNNGTINIDSVDVQNAIAWAYQIAAFIYLGGGIAFTFFGAKLVQLLISGLAGLLAAAIPVYFTQTIFGAIGGLIVFGVVAHQMYK